MFIYYNFDHYYDYDNYHYDIDYYHKDEEEEEMGSSMASEDIFF